MATLKDLLVAGPTRLIGKLFVNDATLVTNLNADMLDGKHASELTSVVKTISRSTNADHYPVFVDSNNSSLTEESLYTAAKIKFNPSTGNLVVGGKVCVGTGGTNSALGSDAANNVWLQNSTGYVVWSANVLRRGTSLSTGILGDTSYPWAGLYTKYIWIDSSTAGATHHIQFNRASYNYITAPSGGTVAISINGASANNSTLAVDGTAAYPGYNNGTKDLGTTTYAWNHVYAKYGIFDTNTRSRAILIGHPNDTQFGGAVRGALWYTSSGYTGTDVVAPTAHGNGIYFSASSIVDYSRITLTALSGIFLDGSVNLSNQLISHVAQGTTPMLIDSSTQVQNLYAEFSQKIQPLHEKVYSNHTCYANNDSSAWIFFGNVISDSSVWQDPYEIYYTVSIDTSVAACHGYYDVYVSVAGSTITCAVINSFYSSSYYPAYTHTLLYHNSQALFDKRNQDNGHHAKIGMRIQSAYGPSTVARTYTVKVWKLVNCHFEFPDNIEIRSNVYSTTYYYLSGYVNATSLGLQETGDSTDTTTMQLVYSYIKAGTNGIKQYSLVMQDSSGNWQSFTTGTGGTGTSKAKNTAGFRLGSRIYYVNRSSDLAAGSTIGSSTVRAYQSLIDLRYSLNITLTAGGANNLVPYKPLYIVGTLGSDGYFYLVDSPWWTQTEPTEDDGKIYIRVGEAIYPDYANDRCYRCDLLSDGYAFWFKDGKFQRYFGVSANSLAANKVTLADSGNANATFYPILAKSTTGDASLYTDAGLTFNASTNAITMTGTLNINMARSSTISPLNLHASSMQASDLMVFRIGKSQSTGNDGQFIFKYVDDNSESNTVHIGFFNNYQILNVLNSGNVGIGTTTPKTKFHVSGGQAEFNSSGTGASTITTATSGIFVGPTSQRSGTAGNYSSGIGFSHMLNYSSSYTNNSVQGWIGLRLTSTSGSELSALVLATKAGTSANDIPTERMCILPTGRIGINEKTPTTLLQITDSSNLSGGRTLFIKNATFNLAAYFYNTLSLYSAMVANSRAINIIGKAESSKNSAYWGYHHAADGSNNNFFTVGVYGVNEVLNVFGSGNVAIGSTVSPANKLDVTGVTNSTSYKVANTATIVYNASTGCLEINT